MNVGAFALTMVMNWVAQSVFPNTHPQIAEEWDLRMMPAGWAFSIWGIIFSLLGVFVGYQALPDAWVPDRNNTLIYSDIGYRFLINMVLNSLWLVFFQFDNAWGFAFALIDIFFMLASDWDILLLSQKSNVNIMEWFTIRGGFSLYSGWITAAAILNAAFMLKSMGLAYPNIEYVYEGYLTVGVLWVGLIIYNLASYIERNPIYGSVLIWVLLAIRDEIVTEKPQFTMIRDHVTAQLIIHGISMVALWSWLASEQFYDVNLIDGWNTGLFYSQ